MADERLERFVKLLKEIFELDKSDLDFGIYRVMNLRKARIEAAAEAARAAMEKAESEEGAAS